MNFIGALTGGAIAGLVGAAVWAGIAYGTGYEIGWIAWGIGLLVGLGVVVGGKSPGVAGAVLAVVITVGSILLGKYATVELLLNKELANASADLSKEYTEENYISFLADLIVAEREENGEPVDWPAGVDPSEAMVERDYPADVWREANAKWAELPEERREEFKKAVLEQMQQNIELYVDQMHSQIAQEGFIQSFSGMDLLFFGLAIYTAFQAAISGGSNEGEGTAGGGEIPA